MIIKKFQGKTKEEALECAKKELGEGIVEMNVKTVKVKDGVALSLSQGKIIPMKQPVKVAVGQDMEATSMEEARAMGQTVADVLSSFPQTMKNQQAGTRENHNQQAAQEAKMDAGKGTVLEEKLDTLQNLLEKQLSAQEEKNTQSEKAMQEESQQEQEENRARVSFLRLLYNKLIDNEVNEKYANEIIDEIDKNCKQDVTMDYMLSEIYQRMILKLGKPYMMEEGTGPKVVFFVGPTGVGKTTTIAKIASSFRVEQNKKVALLTADTYRIAAAEQLRTYANILEVPFRVVYTAQEISQAIEDFNDYDYVLVDTTGHSPNNEAQREGMAELVRSVETTARKEIFLVLSASTKYRDLMKIADTYKEIADYKLIFTKLDETSTLGNIYNLKMYTGAQLSYVTYGQNVPDDIEYFNPQSTVKQLLGGKR